MSLSELVCRHFLVSVELSLLAVIPVLFIASWMGSFPAEQRDSFTDHACRGIAIAEWSLPSFVSKILLLLFYGFLPWLAPGRVSASLLPLIRSLDVICYTDMTTVDLLLNGEPSLFLDNLRYLMLPTCTLTFLSWALLMRVATSSLLTELQQDHVTTARAKGLGGVCCSRPREEKLPDPRDDDLRDDGHRAAERRCDHGNDPQLARTRSVHCGSGSRAGYSFRTWAAMLNGVVLGVVLVVVSLALDVLCAFFDPRVRLG